MFLDVVEARYLGRDPQPDVTADLETEDRTEEERQIEAAARGRDEQA